MALETSWVTHGRLWATLGRLGRAPGRSEVAPESSSVTFVKLWVTPGRLLVHFRSLLVSRSSSKGSLGGPKKVFLSKLIFQIEGKTQRFFNDFTSKKHPFLVPKSIQNRRRRELSLLDALFLPPGRL